LAFSQAVQLLIEARIDPSKDEIVWKDLVDNRDFKAMQAWNPPERYLNLFPACQKCFFQTDMCFLNSCLKDEDIRQNFVTDQYFIKLRNLVLRSLISASGLLRDFPNSLADSKKVFCNPTF